MPAFPGVGQLSTMYVNNFDLYNVGVRAITLSTWRSGPQVVDQTSELNDVAGALLSGLPRQVGSMRFDAEMYLSNTTVDLLYTDIQNLKGLLYRGWLEIRYTKQTTKKIVARCTGFDDMMVRPVFVNPYARVKASFNAIVPYWYADAESTCAIAPVNTRRQVLVSTAPVVGRFFLYGGTNPAIIYRNASGDEKARMSFTVTLGANDRVVADVDTGVIELNRASVITNGASLLSDASTLILPTPLDGDPMNGSYPTVEYTSGTGRFEFRQADL